MSVHCPHCGAVASYDRELAHRSDCPMVATAMIPMGSMPAVEPRSPRRPSERRPLVAFFINEAAEIFERADPEVATGVICVDVPRSEMCFTLDQANRFFLHLTPPPHADGVSSWVPTVDRVELAILAKTLEEVCELGKIAARCIAQGLDDCDPETKVPNKLALHQEIVDMQVRLDTMIVEFDLPSEDETMAMREINKYRFHMSWLRDLARRFGSRWQP